MVDRDPTKEAAVLKNLGISDPSSLPQDKLFEATYSPQELSGLPDYQKIVQDLAPKRDLAREELEGTARPDRFSLGVLEDALRTVNEPGQGTGESEAFKQAGLTGRGYLQQSLNEKSRENQMNFNNFSKSFARIEGGMRDQYSTALDNYNRINQEYQSASDNLLTLERDQKSFERDMFRMTEQSRLQQEAKKEEFTWNSDLNMWANSFGDTKPATPQQTAAANAFNTGEIRSAQSSDITGMNVIDDRHPQGGNCAVYVQTKKGFEWVPKGMGNVNQRQENITRNGFTDSNQVKVGDVVLTSEGKQLDENGILIGHTAIVIGMDGDELILEEANYKGGMVTQGRRLDRNDNKVIGFLSDKDKKVGEVAAEAGYKIGRGDIAGGVSAGLRGALGVPNAVPGYDPNKEGVSQGIEDQLISGGEQATGGTRKEAILAQIRNGLLTKGDATDIRDEFRDDPEFLAEVTKAFNDPKAKQVTAKQAETFNVPQGSTQFTLDDTIASREEQGLGNRRFQAFMGDTKEFEALTGFIQLGERLKEAQQLKKEFNELGGNLGASGRGVQAFAAKNVPVIGDSFQTKELSKLQELEAITGESLVEFVKSISGVAVSDKEFDRLKLIKPNVSMTDKQFDDQLTRAIQDYEESFQAKAQRYGFDSVDQMRNAIRGLPSKSESQDEQAIWDSL